MSANNSLRVGRFSGSVINRTHLPSMPMRMTRPTQLAASLTFFNLRLSFSTSANNSSIKTLFYCVFTRGMVERNADRAPGREKSLTQTARLMNTI